MSKKKTTKKVLKDKPVSLNNDAGECQVEREAAFNKLCIEALSERIENLEENVELLMDVVDVLIDERMKFQDGNATTTYMARLVD